MISLIFTSQIILLVIGFFVGYWFLVDAPKQDNRLRSIGEIFGWIIIAATAFLLICNFVLSMAIISNYSSKAYCPLSTYDRATTPLPATQQGDEEYQRDQSRDDLKLTPQDNDENSQDDEVSPETDTNTIKGTYGNDKE